MRNCPNEDNKLHYQDMSSMYQYVNSPTGIPANQNSYDQLNTGIESQPVPIQNGKSGTKINEATYQPSRHATLI